MHIYLMLKSTSERVIATPYHAKTTSCFSQGPTEHSKALGVYRLETNRDRVVDYNNISKVITVGRFNDFWLVTPSKYQS